MPIELIDTHCHLPDSDQVEAILANCMQNSVKYLVNVGTSLEGSNKAIKAANKHEQVYASIGIYPHEDKDVSVAKLHSALEDLLHISKKIVGIGECGIDISEWENGRSIESQIELFDMQSQLAVEHKLPLIIHNRNGDHTVLSVIEKYAPQGLKGVAHCFSQDWDYAKKLLDCGFYISFSGMITYPARRELLEVVKKMPLNKILVETDSPYLPPQGHRGEPNEPANVKLVAEKVAFARNSTLEAVAEKTTSNAKVLFSVLK